MLFFKLDQKSFPEYIVIVVKRKTINLTQKCLSEIVDENKNPQY